MAHQAEPETCKPPPGPCEIVVRCYQPGDEAAVKRIFAAGMTSTIMPTVRLALVDPLFLLIAAAAAAMAASLVAGQGACAMAKHALMAAGFAVLAIVVWAAQSMAAYISASIAGDLSEIEAFYLRNPQAPASCFWVAEAVLPSQQGDAGGDGAADSDSGGGGGTRRVVVGCVALEQLSPEHGEVRRTTVAAAWQRRGVAEQLCAALVRHAQQRGLGRLELTTTAAQPSALRLYAKLGWAQAEGGWMLAGVPVGWHKLVMRVGGEERGVQRQARGEAREQRGPVQRRGRA